MLILFSCFTGACTSLSFDTVTRHCLASHRPSKSSPHSKHTVSPHLICPFDHTPALHRLPSLPQLFQLIGTGGGGGVSCQALHQFVGGTSHKLLSRSRLYQRPGSDDRLMVAFGDEATNTVSFVLSSSTPVDAYTHPS